MQRNREHICALLVQTAVMPRSGRPGRRRTSTQIRWHPVTGKCAATEDHSSAIPLMNIAVHGHRGANFPVALHAAYGDSDVVDHAEAFAVIRKGVMKTAS